MYVRRGPAVCHPYRLLVRQFSGSCSWRNVSQEYQSTISRLNSLQSNAATIHALRASGNMNENAISEMRSWVKKAGIEQDDINELKFIHVAGTKGKGSTCAMISSILLNYRLAYGRTPKVGLYTSPHLKSVRERIQIDGSPIPKDEWTEYFNDVWSSLEKHGVERPVYFRFITILAFHTFIQECVDVVVLECGVGGEHDSTNIIYNPVATGVTSLGVDHVHVLGKTIEEIAWHKAGIFKPDCPAFSVPQSDSAMTVLRNRARDRQVKSFEIVDRHAALEDLELGLAGDFQKTNASLAITLANEFLKLQGVDENLSIRLPDEFIRGLQTVKWPGRCERRQEGTVEWCLDGGHTTESLSLTGEWYAGIQEPVDEHCLIFNQQSRDATSLLADLQTVLKHRPFQQVIFCTNKTFAGSGYTDELTSVNHSSESVDSLAVQKSLAQKWKDLTGQEAEIMPSIEEAIDIVRRKSADKKLRVLVTGSLHLVGGVMTVLDANAAT